MFSGRWRWIGLWKSDGMERGLNYEFRESTEFSDKFRYYFFPSKDSVLMQLLSMGNGQGKYSLVQNVTDVFSLQYGGSVNRY